MITAAHLRDLIAQAGLTPAQVTRAARINPANLTVYLRGDAQPCPTEQQRLARLLGTTVRDLHDDMSALT